ncbi:hypothetical protein GWE18_40765 [Bradyrhizobium sp. CSA112]|uniref:hypothetical protein n=1 Tax=Bradyrhizobium sp. CSA112 TaxID=2699170 RepID=UPI0023AEF3BD|nr:hypothetical protein [Bradyrhizobium sp. CSA112]MDE5458945.1 hypothetical protein [Bradyrhizobium sp. CSA112]
MRTKQKGMSLVERLTTYPLYISDRPSAFFGRFPREALHRLAREDGYAANRAHAEAS